MPQKHVPLKQYMHLSWNCIRKDKTYEMYRIASLGTPSNHRRYIQFRSVQNLKHASKVQVLIKQKQSSPRYLWGQQKSPLQTFENEVTAWLLHGTCFPFLSPVMSGKQRSALSLLNWNQRPQGNYSNPWWKDALPLMF